MARKYIRPDLSEQVLKEHVPDDTRILINPDLPDVVEALKNLQQRCRKHLLSVNQAGALYGESEKDGFFSQELLAVESAPFSYGYDFRSTQMAACRISDSLVGFVARRSVTPPGESVERIIYPLSPDDKSYEPMKWFRSVCLAFWTRLKDQEIMAMELKCLKEALRLSEHRKAEKSFLAARKRWKNRLSELERSRRFEYSSRGFWLLRAREQELGVMVDFKLSTKDD